MGSFVPTAGSVERQWHLIDAEGQVLGRVATEAKTAYSGRVSAETQAASQSLFYTARPRLAAA